MLENKIAPVTSTDQTPFLINSLMVFRIAQALWRGELNLQTEADQRAASFFRDHDISPCFQEFAIRSELLLQQIKEEKAQLQQAQEDHQKQIEAALEKITSETASPEEAKEQIEKYLDEEIARRTTATIASQKRGLATQRANEADQATRKLKQERERLNKAHLQYQEAQRQQAEKELLEQEEQEKTAKKTSSNPKGKPNHRTLQGISQSSKQRR